MEKRKIIMYIIIIFIILLILGIGYLVYINLNSKEEYKKDYTPEIEISDDKLRETVVSLYFLNRETNELEAEVKQIDSKVLLDNPYLNLITLLIDGPENENLQKIIPENTTVNSAELKNGIVYINLSNNLENEENKEIIIKSIENTLKQLNEVEKIEIINNEKIIN